MVLEGFYMSLYRYYYVMYYYSKRTCLNSLFILPFYFGNIPPLFWSESYVSKV